MEKEKQTRKTPVPQKYSSILAGALKLNLTGRVELIKELKDSIQQEVETKAKEFEAAKATVNGL